MEGIILNLGSHAPETLSWSGYHPVNYPAEAYQTAPRVCTLAAGATRNARPGFVGVAFPRELEGDATWI